MGTVRIAGRRKHSSVNGPGVRYVLFMQGCPHGCPGCQNPETWSMTGGREYDTGAVISEITATRYLDGVTLSGGDPLAQPGPAALIAGACRAAGLNVWCYTGWTFEEIMAGAAGPEAVKALEQIDVLVDGPFVRELMSAECIWRGSSNQRLIDLPRSLETGRAVEIKK